MKIEQKIKRALELILEKIEANTDRAWEDDLENCLDVVILEDKDNLEYNLEMGMDEVRDTNKYNGWLKDLKDLKDVLEIIE